MIYGLRNTSDKSFEFAVWSSHKNRFVYILLRPGEWVYVGSSKRGFTKGKVNRDHHCDRNGAVFGWSDSELILQDESNIKIMSYRPFCVMQNYGAKDYFEMELLYYTTNTNMTVISMHKMENQWMRKLETFNGCETSNGSLSTKLNIRSADGLVNPEWNTISSKKKVLFKMNKFNIYAMSVLFNMRK
eukprot:196841_1